MSDFGFASWDENGTPNNYGIKPTCVVGSVSLTNGQVSGSYSFSIPVGFKVGFVVSLGDYTGGGGRRTITVSGSTITIGVAADNTVGPTTYRSDQSTLVVFLEKL